MKIDKNIFRENFILFLVFLSLFTIGLSFYKDFGISIDENYHRESGKLYYSYIKSFFIGSNIQESVTLNDVKIAVSDLAFRQPAIFDVFAEFIIDFIDNPTIQQVFFTRHFLNFLIFLFSCFFFYLILRKRFKKNFYAYLGLILLFFSPRIFGESFYNNKDIIFLSISIIFIFFALRFFEKKSYLNAFYFGLFSGLAFDIRVMAILYIFGAYLIFFLQYLDDKRFLVKNLKYLILSLITTILSIYIFWPYLWFDPINNIFNFLFMLKSNIPDVQNLYFGEYYLSKNTPWHYNIIWIIITIPTVVTFFSILGLYFLLKNIIKNIFQLDNKNHKFWKSNSTMFDYYFIICVLIILISNLIFAVNYDGWRQTYFLYPFLVILSISGLSILMSKFNEIRLKYFIFFLIFLEISFSIFWIFKNHPHQYIYFNPIFKNITLNKFQLDYWGISNRSSLEYILKKEKKDKIKVATVSFTLLEDSLRVLDETGRNKISIVHNLKEADYVVDNYRKKWDKIDNFNLLKTNFKKIHNLIIDGNIISTIYKRM